MTILSPRALIVPGWLLLGLLMTSCSSQGEGERCDIRNAGADCQEGLACVSFTGSGLSYQLCCPPPPAVSVVPTCNAGSFLGDGGITRDGRSTSDALVDGAASADVALDLLPEISTADTRPEVSALDARTDSSSSDTRPEVAAPDAPPDVTSEMTSPEAPDGPVDGSTDLPSATDAEPDSPLDTGPLLDALDATSDATD
jgi:hypothetical protein